MTQAAAAIMTLTRAIPGRMHLDPLSLTRWALGDVTMI